MSRRDKLFDLPIYKKAELILDLVNSLLNAISEEDEYLNATKYMMRDDAAIICAKIAGAEGGDMYSIRMKNAAIIRDHAMHLYVQVGSLRFHDSFKDTDYVTLIRKEIDEFRELFINCLRLSFFLICKSFKELLFVAFSTVLIRRESGCKDKTFYFKPPNVFGSFF